MHLSFNSCIQRHGTHVWNGRDIELGYAACKVAEAHNICAILLLAENLSRLPKLSIRPCCGESLYKSVHGG